MSELPDCPTCGGKAKVPGMVMLDARNGAGYGEIPCPDCVDGKVSIEQLAATWRAVWDEIPTLHPRGAGWVATVAAYREFLRAVRP